MRHPVVPCVVAIPHRASTLWVEWVEVVVLQRGASVARGLSGASVGGCFGEEHYVSGLAGDFTGAGRVEPRSAPAFPVEL